MSVSMTISVSGELLRDLDDIAWHKGMNVQEAMEAAYGSEKGFGFTIQYFGADLGYEVVILDSISQQAGTDTFLFWELSINGKIAKTGIDETILSDGDQIEWNYTLYSEARHGETRYEKLKKTVTGNSGAKEKVH